MNDKRTEKITTGEGQQHASPDSISASRSTVRSQTSAVTAGLPSYSQAEIARQMLQAPALFARAVLCGRRASDFAVNSINRVMFAQVLRGMK